MTLPQMAAMANYNLVSLLDDPSALQDALEVSVNHLVKGPMLIFFWTGVYDRKRAMEDMAKNEDVDVITGWWILAGVEIRE